MPSPWLERLWHLRKWRSPFWVASHPVTSARFVWRSKEITNFTYAIRNKEAAKSFLSSTGLWPESAIARTMAELDDDETLRTELAANYSRRQDREPRVQVGRRVVWYAVARLLKPRLIIETGTADGLGTALLARALQRNGTEGSPGIVASFDMGENAGWVIPDELRSHVRLVQGDLRLTLPEFLRDSTPVHLFVHDSDHSAAHESWEYQTIGGHLAPNAVVITDNAHATKELKEFADRTNRQYNEWQEQPQAHPYTGATLGLAWERRQVALQRFDPMAFADV
jgi:hypothetical protein